MNFLIQNWYLIAAALVSGAMLLWAILVAGSQGAAISTAQAVQLLNREKGVLLDVSEPEEFAKVHAAGARNVPFGQIEGGHKSLPSNKSLPLVVVCPTGARAGRAAGMPVAVAVYGYLGQGKSPQQWDADFWANDPRDILNYLQR